MATLSSHILNGADGTHAGDVSVKLINADTGDTIIESATDADGRFSETFNLKGTNVKHRYELIINTADYWKRKDVSSDQLIDEIVLRFSMPDADARYHKPVIIAPHSYSTWSSVAE